MERIPICDTHAHYDDEAFDSDRGRLLETGLTEGGVEFAVNVGASMRGADASAELARRFRVIYAGCGIHPDDVGVFAHAGFLQDADRSEGDGTAAERAGTGETGDGSGSGSGTSYDPEEAEILRRRRLEWARFSCADEAMEHLRKLCSGPKVVCVGEIGLDYHWMVEEKAVQQRWFREQMRLAFELGLPINVHSRNAAQDTFDLIRENYDAGQATGGIIHCYSGSRELAREYVKMGYHLGIGGVITFKNSKTLKRVVEDTPIERLVTETDCPYLSPEPNRGKRNDSRNIRFVIEKIAELKQMDVEECARILQRNAHEVYRI